MNFAQTTGPGKAAPVARLGMSYDQAKQVIQTLQLALLKAQYQPAKRLLPPTDNATNNSDN